MPTALEAGGQTGSRPLEMMAQGGKDAVNAMQVRRCAKHLPRVCCVISSVLKVKYHYYSHSTQEESEAVRLSDLPEVTQLETAELGF